MKSAANPISPQATSRASQDAGQTALGMTFVQSKLLVIQLMGLLAASGGIFKWYDQYFAPFHRNNPILSWAIVISAPLYIFCFSVGPQIWRLHRQKGRDAITITAQPGMALNARYFRLDPYVTGTPAEFQRDDGVHVRTLDWLRAANQPVLFLSGVSGAGKSSVLEGYVIPMLGAEGVRIERIRSFDEPLSQLRAILAHRRPKGSRLLIVFDQFEEFIVLEDRKSAEERRQFLAQIKELQQAAAPGLSLLFSFRRDYMGDVIDMQLAELIPGRTFMDIDAFKHDAARRFFEKALHASNPHLIDRLLAGAEQLDDVPSRFRPVTLNMLGLALQDLDHQLSSPPERLVQRYMEAAIAQPEIREIAPSVVSSMISKANTKTPCDVNQLKAATGLKRQDILACLVLLEQRGLARRLDGTSELWELSHDFVARQFALLLARLRPNPWPKIAMFAAPLLFFISICAAGFGIPRYVHGQAYRELAKLSVQLEESPSGEISARFDPEHVSYTAVVNALPYLILLDITELDLSRAPIDTLPSLDKLTHLKSLDLSGASISSLPSLDGLIHLENLHLSLTRISTLPSLDKLTALRNLDLNMSKVTTLPSLDNLTALQELYLSNTQINTLPSLDKLTGLRKLFLSYSPFNTLPSFDKLTALQELELAECRVAVLPSFDQLSALRKLGLQHIQAALPSLDHLTQLETLDLTAADISTLPSLDKLTALRELDISQSEVTMLPSLDKLTRLEKFNASYANLSTLPSLDKLVALRELYLQDSRVDPLPSLDHLQALRSLNLIHSKLTVLPPLDKLTSLKSLDIDQRYLNEKKNIEAIAQVRSRNVKVSCGEMACE